MVKEGSKIESKSNNHKNSKSKSNKSKSRSMSMLGPPKPTITDDILKQQLDIKDFKFPTFPHFENNIEFREDIIIPDNINKELKKVLKKDTLKEIMEEATVSPDETFIKNNIEIPKNVSFSKKRNHSIKNSRKFSNQGSIQRSIYNPMLRSIQA